MIKCEEKSITTGHWPGWDCHGLPIELKAIKGGKRLEASKVGSEGKKLIFNQTKQTREIAGKFAADTVEAQSKEFQSWGLMADWENRYRLDRDWIKRKTLYVCYSEPWIQNTWSGSYRLFSLCMKQGMCSETTSLFIGPQAQELRWLRLNLSTTPHTRALLFMCLCLLRQCLLPCLLCQKSMVKIMYLALFGPQPPGA